MAAKSIMGDLQGNFILNELGQYHLNVLINYYQCNYPMIMHPAKMHQEEDRITYEGCL